MKIITPELLKKYAITSLTLNVHRDAKGNIALNLDPLRHWVLGVDEDTVGDMVDCSMSDSTAVASITATAEGVTSTGFDVNLPSFLELKALMLRSFEEFRRTNRKLLLAIDADEGKDMVTAIKSIVLAMSTGKVVAAEDVLVIEPVDELYADQIAEIFIGSLFGGQIVQRVSSVDVRIVLAGAPRYLGVEAAKEINDLVRQRFLDMINKERDAAIRNLRSSRKADRDKPEQAPSQQPRPAAEASTDVGMDHEAELVGATEAANGTTPRTTQTGC